VYVAVLVNSTTGVFKGFQAILVYKTEEPYKRAQVLMTSAGESAEVALNSMLMHLAVLADTSKREVLEHPNNWSDEAQPWLPDCFTKNAVWVNGERLMG
jgi:hypothetical protein